MQYFKGRLYSAFSAPLMIIIKLIISPSECHRCVVSQIINCEGYHNYTVSQPLRDIMHMCRKEEMYLRVIICKDQTEKENLDSGALKKHHIPIFYSSYGYNNSHHFFWPMVKYFWIHSYVKLKKIMIISIFL